ncbi:MULTISPECIES: MFS transporter [Frigoribacterium]|uniref:MFS transporter n=1 Tax=Frigoribacterium TaxID=96492 RepID=UPI00177B6CB2|nr:MULTISPECIES: MFS transporter [Frigoribacterium]MBD8704682.1 MFS transporter [Frigoribacterium sp. CFBP 13712]MCJ0701842.1 MFS transporter [Frigoribacterium faeni]MDY0893311.1 MFS transporter [Frigoribacterium sp. CFBP9030]
MTRASSAVGTPTRAGTRQWAALVVLMLPVLLVSIDNTVLSFALPEISTALRPSAAGQLWIVDVYSLVLAGLLVAMGSLGDRFGRRRLLLIGASGFALVSLGAAFAPDAGTLVAARAVLGFFGAMIMPATLSLLRSTFLDRDQRRLAIAIWASGFAAGSALGPIVGGILLEHFAWGSIFLIAVPVLVPLLVLAPILLVESRDPEPGPFDPVSVLLSLTAMAPVVAAIKLLATHGPGVDVVALAALGIASGWLFVRRQLRRERPLLDVRLFSNPVFAGSIVVNLLAILSLVGFLFFTTQHLQLVVGLRPLQAALTLVPGLAVMIVAGLIVVPIVRRVTPRVIVAAGLASAAIGYATVWLSGAEAPVVLFVVAFALVGLGVGAAETISNDQIIAAVPPARAGAASAVSETAYEVGAVLGTAVLGSMLTAIYRGSLVIPDGVPAEAGDAARETLGGAVSAAGSLDASVAGRLLDAATHAFDEGLVATAGVGAGVMVVAVVVALVSLRRASAHD